MELTSDLIVCGKINEKKIPLSEKDKQFYFDDEFILIAMKSHNKIFLFNEHKIK